MSLRACTRSLLAALMLGAAAGHATIGHAATQSPPDRVSAIHENASLEDPRFAPSGVRMARKDLPAFQRDYAGLYLLGGEASDRVHVVFIHGINGSPRDFSDLIESLDRDRFQPCVFYYASGAALDSVTAQLASALAELAARYRVRSIVIVAHSMGGLIARQLLVSELQPTDLEVPLLVTLSTPWEGHAAAAFGARLVPAWRDIATGSPYLAGIFATTSGRQKRLPLRTQHHLLFSYRKRWMAPGSSGDRVVSVASQLAEPAQAQASRIYGFDVTHTGILKDAAVAALLRELLAATFGTEVSVFPQHVLGCEADAASLASRLRVNPANKGCNYNYGAVQRPSDGCGSSH